MRAPQVLPEGLRVSTEICLLEYIPLSGTIQPNRCERPGYYVKDSEYPLRCSRFDDPLSVVLWIQIRSNSQGTTSSTQRVH